MKLHRARTWSRRSLLGAGAMLVGLAPLALVPWRVGAQEADTEEKLLSQQWEDLLLLEAARYLRLTSGQLQQIRPVTRFTDDRLHKLQEQEGRTQATLQRITDRQRTALLAGKTVSLDEQANALLLEKGLRPAREKAALEITAYAAPRLARVLTPDQIARAFLLTLGEMPPNVAKRPALLDPQSGFVLAEAERLTARTAAAHRVLARHYSPAIVEALGQTSGHEVYLVDLDQQKSRLSSSPELGDFVLVESRRGQAFTGPDGQRFVHLSPGSIKPPAGMDLGLFEAAQRDRERLEKLPVLTEELTRKGSPADLAEAVAHTARRLFTSPRWKVMVEERLQRGGMVVEGEGEPG